MQSIDTMRAFWDRHGYWTHDILEADSEDIPSRARVVAGSHHMDRGIDPYNFSSGDDVATLENRLINTRLPWLEVTRLMTKQWMQSKNILSPKYENDVMMNRVLKALDAIGKRETLFEEAA